jgi:glucose-1-phosphate thymidylyltransferase
MAVKGIILAGGSGTRLYPITKSISKHLLPIYDKPMIYYSISVLMLAGIRDILIICDQENLNSFKNLLGNGSNFGLKFKYKVQNKPDGIASAIILGEKFIKNDKVCLILGDNIFYGQDFQRKLSKAISSDLGANIFAYKVADPKNYGIINTDKRNNPTSIVEKPANPKSNWAVTGLYFYNNTVIEKAKHLKKSKRGEYEISDINNIYLKEGDLGVQYFGRGFAWLDTGTCDNLISASQFVETIEKRQGLKIACLEEIAFRNNWIKKKEIIKIFRGNIGNTYYEYLMKVVKDKT